MLKKQFIRRLAEEAAFMLHWVRHKAWQDTRFLRQYLADMTRRPAPPARVPILDVEEDAVWWLGHSTVLVLLNGVRLITDPVLLSHVGLRLGPFVIGPKRFIDPGIPLAELPRLDAIVLSHAHMDHMDLNTLRHLRHVPTVTARGTADLLRKIGFTEIVELGWNERTEVRGARGSIAVVGIPVNHRGARFRRDTWRSANAYLLEGETSRVLFAGDTAYTETFAEAVDGLPDLALMPIGAYEPFIHLHVNPEQAVAMASTAGARRILPIHHSTFELGYEPREEPLQRFLACAGRTTAELVSWEVGERVLIRGARGRAEAT